MVAPVRVSVMSGLAPRLKVAGRRVPVGCIRGRHGRPARRIDRGLAAGMAPHPGRVSGSVSRTHGTHVSVSVSVSGSQQPGRLARWVLVAGGTEVRVTGGVAAMSVSIGVSKNDSPWAVTLGAHRQAGRRTWL